MMNLLSPVEENKPMMCFSPQEKTKSAGSQRTKRSHGASALGSTSDAKKARLDDMFKNEAKLDLDGWISGDYLRTMDFDESLSQDIDWVSHDDMDLALNMDVLVQDHTTNDDVNDFDFSPSSFLRGSFSFEDSAEMASTFVDPAYIRLNSSRTKDAEKLLMSFDTMKFKIPSPTSISSKKRKSVFVEKNAAANQYNKLASTMPTVDAGALVSSIKSPNPAAAEDVCVESACMSATSISKSSLSVSAPMDSLLNAVNIGTATSSSNSKKIGLYSPAARKLRLQKFHEKRKNRTWKKSIKYDCRKKLADDRPRIKGRFVRVLENVGDTNTNGASSSSTSSSIGYASPIDAMVAAPLVKAEVATSCLSTLTSAAKQAASVTKSTPLAASTTSSTSLPFARMIASV